jgi:hypothetical protein
MRKNKDESPYFLIRTVKGANDSFHKEETSMSSIQQLRNSIGNSKISDTTILISRNEVKKSKAQINQIYLKIAKCLS